MKTTKLRLRSSAARATLKQAPREAGPLKAYHARSGDREDVERVLNEAESDFAQHRNPMVALYGAMLALDHHLPVPRRIATWLRYGIAYYVHGRRDSLDAGLGLNSPGRANPRRRRSAAVALTQALSRMFWLQCLGAKVPEAAALVSRLSPDYMASTLEYHYRRGGFSPGVKEYRASFAHNPTDPESTLAEYPDRPIEAAQAKAAIRAMYAKQRP